MGPPGSLKGMCVYDWDKCKLPVPPAAMKPMFKRSHRTSVAELHDEVVPPAPKKSACNMTIQVSLPPLCKWISARCRFQGCCDFAQLTQRGVAGQEDCDANKCCQWCGSIFNATASGFCMPMIDVPVPSLTCSKGGALCSAAADEVRRAFSSLKQPSSPLFVMSNSVWRSPIPARHVQVFCALPSKQGSRITKYLVPLHTKIMLDRKFAGARHARSCVNSGRVMDLTKAEGMGGGGECWEVVGARAVRELWASDI